MKSYWIFAVAVGVIAWPSGARAYVADPEAASLVGQAVQQSPSPDASSAAADAAKPQPAAEAVKPGANEQPPSATGAAPAPAQPKTSFLLIELRNTLKANKLKPGDKVKAEIAQDVLSHGKIIIPVETQLLGHVTEVGVREGESGESRLGFVFDRIVLKHFRDVTFQGVVQAVSPPVQRRSRVDEPSQMLPPSMTMGDRSAPTLPGSRGQTPSSRSNSSPSPSPQLGAANSMVVLQAPLTVKESPSTHTASGTSAATLGGAGGGSSMSVGMPHGVTGLKGLSLTDGATANTPGPVVISTTNNVKLEAGTQILLRVTSVEKLRK